ncbi:MAG TPA: TonB-dependent receptor, partial [Cyclobacteriaceae bacterium]|nr:TonB-dependent receptor [Cyclobacteriaceae bacterium]
YSVLGTEVVVPRLAELESQGQIQTYLFDVSTIGKLEAERSIALNVGGHLTLFQSLSIDLNGFYNSINNLIETQAVALTTSGQSIYTYRNIKRAYTSGLESNFSYPLTKNFSLSLGYQLLYAKDKDVVQDVRDGNVYWRDPNTFNTYRLKPNEYYGLYNRSRNTANIKLFYSNAQKGWEGSLRVIYRGKYGVGDIRGNIQGEVIPPSDVNNNSILDTHDSFVSGYPLLNISAAKTFKKTLRLQIGVDNLLNHTEPVFIPNLAGRLMYASVSYAFVKNVKP